MGGSVKEGWRGEEERDEGASGLSPTSSEGKHSLMIINRSLNNDEGYNAFTTLDAAIVGCKYNSLEYNGPTGPR